jgi:hypothetical protein
MIAQDKRDRVGVPFLRHSSGAGKIPALHESVTFF